MSKLSNIQNHFEISIIIPVFNEAENVRSLAFELSNSLKEYTYEIIFIDDGSTDSTKQEIIKISKNIKNLRLIIHKTRSGQSVAMRTGIMSSNFNVIGTIDGDGQNNPKDFIKLINSFANKSSKLLLVTGNRIDRQDSFNKKWASSFARLIRKYILGDIHPDSGCGIRVFDKELFFKMPFFNHMHRFFPTLALREGAEVLSVAVSHRKREAGVSKYSNLGRGLAGIYDLIGVIWLLNRSSKDISFNEHTFNRKD